MNSQTTVVKHLIVEPQYISQQKLHNYILHKFRKQSELECSKDYGYILNVHSNFEILRNHISNATSNPIFTVKFTIENLKPEIGSIFVGPVCMIFNKGVFISVLNKLKIFIPIDENSGYKFVQATNSFVLNQNKKIDSNSVLTCEIIGMKYTNHKFNCVGRLC